MAHDKSRLSRERYQDADDALEGAGWTTASWWAEVAAQHHSYGEWSEAQAAAGVAQAYAAIELDTRLQAIARAR